MSQQRERAIKIVPGGQTTVEETDATRLPENLNVTPDEASKTNSLTAAAEADAKNLGKLAEQAGTLEMASKTAPDGTVDKAGPKFFPGIAAITAAANAIAAKADGISTARSEQNAATAIIGNPSKANVNDSVFCSIEEALEEIRAGRFVVVADDEGRENEGDLICAAELITPEMVNFMVTEARGWVCLSMTKEKADYLNLPLMVKQNTESQQTAFTITIDADTRFGVTTGISAHDRATTIRVVADASCVASDLRRPGHVSPLVAKAGGVLQRAGHTEAAVDLARLAGLTPCGVICEIMNADGTMSRVPELAAFAKKHNLKVINIAQLISYRLTRERFVVREAVATMPSAYGQFTVYAYRNTIDNAEHLAFVRGNVTAQENVLIRVHSECLTGDVFASLRCDCGPQLEAAMAMIAKEEKGVLVYLRQEGRGIGLLNKIKAYALQDTGKDTVQANEMLGFRPDLRDYGVGAQILCDLGLSSVRIITNNPRKIIGLEGYGLTVTDRVSLPPMCNSHNHSYLVTKKEKMGHWLEGLDGLDQMH